MKKIWYIEKMNVHLQRFRKLTAKHSSAGVQVLGSAIAFMAFANILSGFSLQCVENSSARSMNKIDLLIGGAAMAFGGMLVVGARMKMLQGQEHVAIGIGSLFLMAQAILSLAGQSKEKDCQKGVLSTLGNIVSIILALIGFTSMLTRK